jgi:hypothetical protein
VAGFVHEKRGLEENREILRIIDAGLDRGI